MSCCCDQFRSAIRKVNSNGLSKDKGNAKQ
ncbi:hypothetical protein Tco_1536575, partial [Tanacetum coccineum]